MTVLQHCKRNANYWNHAPSTSLWNNMQCACPIQRKRFNWQPVYIWTNYGHLIQTVGSMVKIIFSLGETIYMAVKLTTYLNSAFGLATELNFFRVSCTVPPPKKNLNFDDWWISLSATFLAVLSVSERNVLDRNIHCPTLQGPFCHYLLIFAFSLFPGLDSVVPCPLASIKLLIGLNS